MTQPVRLLRGRAGRQARVERLQRRRPQRPRVLQRRTASSRVVQGGGGPHRRSCSRPCPPPAGEMPVVLAAGSSGILLHEAIGHGMEADFNRKGVSIYADKIGKPIAKPFVNIVDEGTQEGARGAINVDDEGNAAGRTIARAGRRAHHLPPRHHLRQALRGRAHRQRPPRELPVRAHAAHALDLHAARPAHARRDHRLGEEGHLLQQLHQRPGADRRRRLHVLRQERLPDRGRQAHAADQGREHHRQRPQGAREGGHGRRRPDHRRGRLDLRQGRPERAGLAGDARPCAWRRSPSAARRRRARGQRHGPDHGTRHEGDRPRAA